METLSKAAVKIWRIGNNQFKEDRLQIIVVAKNITLLQLFISRMPKMCTIPKSASAPLNPTVLQLFISRMPKMCAIPQLVSAPLNPIPIVEHFRRSHPQCEHS